MKKIYFFFIFLLLTQITLAQWTLVGNALPSTVRGLYFENPDTGYAVGFDGTTGVVSKTIDGGVTWTPTIINGTFLLRGVTFVNKDTGFVCGVIGNGVFPATKGVVIKTEDAGSSWNVILTDTPQYFRAVDFISTDTGFIGGAAGTILKTTDGGSTWSTLTLSQTTSDVIQVNMIDDQTGYAVCATASYPYAPGYVFKTSDGGATWNSVYSNAGAGFLGLAVADASTVYAGGTNQIIIKTTDGGATWDTVYTSILTSNIRAGFALSGSVAYMVDDGSHVLSTEDGGITWNDTLLSGGLYSIYFSGLIGYTANGSGAAYRDTFQCTLPLAATAITGPDSVCSSTTEQYSIDPVTGAESYSWSVPTGSIINSGQGTTQISVTFGSVSGQVSVTSVDDLCGDGGNISMDVTVNPSPSPTITFSNGTLASSNVTGNQWYLDGSPIGGAVDSTFTPALDGTYYTVVTNSYGCSGISNSFAVVAAHWTALTSGVTNILRSVYFINDSVGWVCGETDGFTSPILKTTDSGDSWTLINYAGPSLRGVQFVDINTGIIVGLSGIILRSTDSGTTWDTIPSGTTVTLRSVSFPSHDTGYACGSLGTILKTTDAGLTWTPQVSGLAGDLINIRFSSNDTGYAVQSGPAVDFLDGFVIKTTDGGATWDTVLSDTSVGLLALAAVDENTAYVGGRAETIFKTSDGGANWTQVYAQGDTTSALRGSHFLNDNTGWIVGTTTNSAVLYTNDGGGTWTNQSPVIGTGIEFLGIHFPSSNVGFTVGTLGTILRYSQSCTLADASTALTGLDSVCSGSTSQFSIDPVIGASSYTWSVPADAVINSGQGTTDISVTFGVLSGQVSATSENACGAGGSISMNIVINPSPSPTITFSGNTLSSSDPVGNQWYYNGSAIGGATDSTYTPILNGDYYTIVTNSYGCSDTSNTITVIGLGIYNTSGSLLAIFPNPSEDACMIYFPKMENGKLTIINAAGAIEFSENNLTGESYNLNTSSLPNGFYLVRMYDREGHLIATSKLIVQ